jgi:hypothetical protein
MQDQDMPDPGRVLDETQRRSIALRWLHLLPRSSCEADFSATG